MSRVAAPDGGRGHDAARAQIALFGHERASWRIDWKCEKWNGQDGDARRLRGDAPDEVIHIPGNLLCNAGINRLEDLLIGAGGQALDNTHCRIGVGDGTTAAAATDTDLSAAAGSTHRWFQLMDSTYPSRSSQTITFKSTFASADGNFHWQEWCIDAGTANANTVTAPMLNRRLQDLGTKVSGSAWAMSATLVIS